MVSNEDVKKRLELKRKGIDPDDPKLKDKICPKCGTKNSFTSDFCLECGENIDSKSLGEKNFEINYKLALEKNTPLKEPKIINKTIEKPIVETFDECLKAIQKSKLNIVYSDKHKGQITASYNKDEIYIKLHDYKDTTMLVITLNPNSNSNSYKKAKKLTDNILKLVPEFIRTNEDIQYEKLPKEDIQFQILGQDDHANQIIITNEEEGINISGKGAFTGWDKGNTFIRYEDITSIGYKKGLVLGTLKISVPGRIMKVRSVIPKQGINFTDYVQAKVQQVKSKSQKTSQNTQTEQKLSPMEEIKKAKELLDIGAINHEEFEKIKNKYINLIV